MIRLPRSCPSWAWLIPPALLVLVVATLCVDVLQWDEWIIWGTFLDKLQQGTFGAADLIAQHNEHRYLGLRLLGFPMLELFKLNRFAAYGLSVLLAGGLFLAADRLYGRTTGGKTPACARLVFAAFAFSLLQWETFSIGFNSALLLVVLGIWLGVLVASGGPLTLPRMLALGLIGIVPSFTFANGVFYWGCLAPLIIFQGGVKQKKPWLPLLWVVMAGVVFLGYFLGYESPGQHPSVWNGLGHPVQLVGYFLGNLGGGITSDHNLIALAILTGGCSLVLLCCLAWVEWRAGGPRRERLLPWLCVALFSLMSSGVTAFARCGFGVGQAVESRYATFTGPYWMALSALLFMRWARTGAAEKPRVFTRWVARTFCAVFLLSTVLCFIVMFNRHDRFVQARKALYSLTDEHALRTIFPDTAYLMMKLPLFLERRLAIYRDIKRFNEYALSDQPCGDFVVAEGHSGAEGRVPGMMVAGTVGEGGMPDTGTVLLVEKNRVVAVLPVRRSDGTRWRLFLPANNLQEGAGNLKAYVLPEGGRRLLPLQPTEGVPVNPGKPVEPAYHWGRHFFER